MPYYLQHYFMPDFNHKRLRPVKMADGNVHAHFLGYVQSVVAGQVLAELVYLDSIPEGFTAQDAPLTGNERVADELAMARDEHFPLPMEKGYPTPQALPDGLYEDVTYGEFSQRLFQMDPRFVYNNPIFPQGPNCERDPGNPNRILAAANGYCFYHRGLITVKKLLNVRQDVNFYTGNILFVGDIVIHGDVFPGFFLTGANVLIKGRVDGGTIKARGTVVAEKGIKGSPTASITAGDTVRVGYAERAMIITPGNLVIDGDCIHSDLFVGGSLVVKGRLQGGNVHANGLVYVEKQIGDSQGATTRISLGYNPLDYLKLRNLDGLLTEQNEKLHYHTSQARKGPSFAAEAAPYQELATRKIEILKRMQNRAWRKFSADLRDAEKTRIVAPGKIHPGVEITIGRAYLKVIDEQNDACFFLREDEVEQGYPARSKHFRIPAGGEA